MRRWWIWSLAAILVLAGGVWRGRVAPGGGNPPGPAVPALARSAAALGGVELETPPLRIDVLSITRPTRDVVEVRLAVTNRDPVTPLLLGDRFADVPAEVGTLSGAFLTSTGGSTRTFVLRDASGAPQCSRGLEQLGPGERREAWVRFSSPHAEAGPVKLTLAGVPPLDGLVLPGAR